MSSRAPCLPSSAAPSSAPSGSLSPPPPGAPSAEPSAGGTRSASDVGAAVEVEEDGEEPLPQKPPSALAPLPASAAAASMPSPLSAAALAAAILASRRSDPAIHGQMMVKLSAEAAKATVRGLPCDAPAPVAGASSGQLPAPLEPLPAVSSSQPRPIALPVEDPPRSGVVDELVAESLSSEQVVLCSEKVPAVVDAAGGVGLEDTPWVLVQPRRSLRRTGAPPVSKMRPPPPAWLNGRCHRCHDAGHWASSCCEPLRCNNCRELGHKAKCCTGRTAPRPPPVQVRHPALTPAAVRPRPWQRPPPREKLQPESPCQPVRVQLQSALDKTLPLLRPTTPPSLAMEDVRCALAEQAMLLRCELHSCLARVESFLARVGVALGTSPVVSEASPPTEINVGSADVGEEDLYGGHSPRAMPSPQSQPNVLAAFESEVKAPVMMIMPELQELGGELAPPPLQEVDSVGSSAVTSIPPSLVLSQPSVDSEALFAKELCDLLVSLEKVSPGSGKEIVYLLSGKETGSKIKKVKEFLGSKTKKSGGTRKVSAAA